MFLSNTNTLLRLQPNGGIIGIRLLKSTILLNTKATLWMPARSGRKRHTSVPEVAPFPAEKNHQWHPKIIYIHAVLGSASDGLLKSLPIL